ncbi:M20 family metallopeptidase [Natronomonas sp. EA1]|uniref:M20 family metallopeptidase n=1 Tax=Natronomonas sp. EA1 TaxID=3421655 RepID=UPI003EBDFF66
MFDIETFHAEAVRTPSHEDVAAMRAFLLQTLEAHGVPAEVDDAGNVLATKGDGSPHVVLNTHIDTVPPHIPYERDGDTVRGRGACDAKGPLAALLDAFLATEPDGKLTLAVTPDEEVYSTGAAHLRERLSPDWVIVGEPTGLDVCTAAKGRFEGAVSVSGIAAHAAEPESGRNAIRGAAPLLEALDSFDDEHGPGTHPQLGAPTLTVTTIEGGAATNQVPAECRFTVDRRSVPPETAEGFRTSLTEHLRTHAPDNLGIRFALTERETPFLEAFATDTDDPVVTALADAAGGDVRPFTAATEASYFAQEAPTVVFGPGDLADEEGAVAHAEREYVRLKEVHAAADALRETLDTLVG